MTAERLDLIVKAMEAADDNMSEKIWVCNLPKEDYEAGKAEYYRRRAIKTAGMDQAQGLRELVAKDKVGSFEIIEHPEMPPKIAVMIQQWEGWHNGKYFREGVESDPPAPDKAKLWDELKAELERGAIGPAESQSLKFKTIGGFEPRRAQAVLDRMEQAETLARLK